MQLEQVLPSQRNTYNHIFALIFLGAYFSFLAADLLHSHEFSSLAASRYGSVIYSAEEKTDPYSDGHSHCLLNSFSGSISSQYYSSSSVCIPLPYNESGTPEPVISLSGPEPEHVHSLRAPPVS